MGSSNSGASRRGFLKAALTTGGTAALYPALGAGRAIPALPIAAASEIKAFELDEITITELQNGMKSGRFTARSLLEQYLGRIEEIDRPGSDRPGNDRPGNDRPGNDRPGNDRPNNDKRGPAVNAIIELNPDAPSIADGLDQERRAKGPRGPLHGIPVLIKDNIDTADRMMTTAGSLALVG